MVLYLTEVAECYELLGDRGSEEKITKSPTSSLWVYPGDYVSVWPGMAQGWYTGLGGLWAAQYMA